MLLRCRAHGKQVNVYSRSIWGSVEVGRILHMTADAGSVIAVESTHPELGIELTVQSEGHNITCSRGNHTLETHDWCPPLHSQVVRIDTRLLDDAGFSFNFQYRYKPSQQKCLSRPAIQADLLHTPFPYCL